MSDIHEIHNRMIATANRIPVACSAVASESRNVHLTGKIPHLPIPIPSTLIEEEILSSLPPAALQIIYEEIGVLLHKTRHVVVSNFNDTIEGIKSEEDWGGVKDIEVKTNVCRVYEGIYSRSICHLEIKLKEMVERWVEGVTADTKKGGSSFTPHALSVLEAGYATSTVLSQAETAIVAEEAGLTAHQVRTWFQNRRNRSKKSHSRSAQPATHAASSAPRIVSALPKRAGGPSKQKQIYDNTSISAQGNASAAGYLSPSPEPSHPRFIKGLPRRAQPSAGQNNGHGEDNGASLSSPALLILPSTSAHSRGDSRGARSPSIASSHTSSDTVPVNGGFISPFAMHIPDQTAAEDHNPGPQINIAWEQGMVNVPVQALQGVSAPQFDFTPPTPLNVSFISPSSHPITHNTQALHQTYPLPIPKSHRPPQMPMYRTPPGRAPSHSEVERCGVQQAAGLSSGIQQGMMDGVGMSAWQDGMSTAFGGMGLYEKSWGFKQLESEARSGLESIEDMLDAAFSHPDTFAATYAAPTSEHNSTLTLSRSPQFTEDTTPSPTGHLSRSSSLSVPAAGPSGSSPGYPMTGDEDGDDFFATLSGLLATPPNMSPTTSPANPTAMVSPTQSPSSTSSSPTTLLVTPSTSISNSSEAHGTSRDLTRSSIGYEYSWPFNTPASAAADEDVIDAQYAYVKDTQIGDDGVAHTVVVRQKKPPTGWDGVAAFGDPKNGFQHWVVDDENPMDGQRGEVQDVQLRGGEQAMDEQHQEMQDSAWGWIPGLLPFESEDIAMIDQAVTETTGVAPAGENNPEAFEVSPSTAPAPVDYDFAAPSSAASSSTLPPATGFPTLPPLPPLPPLVHPHTVHNIHSQHSHHSPHDSHPNAMGMDVDQPPAYTRQAQGTSFSSSNFEFAPYSAPTSDGQASWGPSVFVTPIMTREPSRESAEMDMGFSASQQQLHTQQYSRQLDGHAQGRYVVLGMPFDPESMEMRTRAWESGTLDVPDDCSSGESTGMGPGY